MADGYLTLLAKLHARIAELDAKVDEFVLEVAALEKATAEDERHQFAVQQPIVHEIHQEVARLRESVARADQRGSPTEQIGLQAKSLQQKQDSLDRAQRREDRRIEKAKERRSKKLRQRATTIAAIMASASSLVGAIAALAR